jgi:hypothetical protein
MDFKELTAKECLKLPEPILEWLKRETGAENVEDKQQLIKFFDDFINEEFSIFYHDGDYNDELFSFDDEGGFVIVNGSVNSDKSAAFYGITVAYITGSVVTNDFVTQDSAIIIDGDVKVKENLIISDSSTYLEIKGKLNVRNVINQIPDTDLAKQIKIGLIEHYEKAYFSENSYGLTGSKEFLENLGFFNAEELTEMNPVWKEIY